jgi:hypothetical protein
LGVQKRFRFGSDFRKTYYRPIRSCAGQIGMALPELKLTLSLPTNSDRSRIVRPSPNGRGAERVGRVVEKNCIMWVDKLVLWEYTVSRLIGGGREMLKRFEVSELLPWQQTNSDRVEWGPQNT